MRILLLNPPAPGSGWYQLEHLGLAYIAAVLRQAGHDTRILDANLEGLAVTAAADAANALAPFDLIGLTAMEPLTFQAGLEIVERLRDQGHRPTTILGGYFATFWGQKVIETCPLVDVVVLGEGEQTVLELVRAIETNASLAEVDGICYRDGSAVRTTIPRRLVADLDQLPFPARDYVRQSYERHHVAGLYGSRGCVHRCTFCQIEQFYRLAPGSPYRTRTEANLVAEIMALLEEHGCRNLLFVDDEFIEGSPRRLRVLSEFIQLLRQKKVDIGFAIQYRADQGHNRDLLAGLKSVGLTTVFIGVESGLDSVLARYDKRIDRRMITRSLAVARELELQLIAGYILFDPYTTFDELRANVDYLMTDEAPTILDLHGMIVLKGTPDEARLRRQGRLKEEGFQLHYPTPDPDLRVFKALLNLYYPVSSPSVHNIYRLHLMVGRFPASERRMAMLAVAEVLSRLRALHQTFLRRAVDDVINKRDGNGWLDELTDAHRELAADSWRLIQAWESVLAAR